MAIVLVIVGLVISTLATVLPSLISSAKVKKTKAVLEKTDYNLRGYMGASGRLPCPDTNGDGTEDRNDNALIGNPVDDTCTAYSGTLPFLTLGMSNANDAWNNVSKYAVYEELIRTTPDTGTNPACSVLAALITTPITPVTSRLHTTDPAANTSNKAYVLVSGGPKNLDGNGDGFYDGFNEGNDLQFDHPNRPPDHSSSGNEYDDLMVVASLSYLSGANCNAGGGGGGGGGGTGGIETLCTDGIDNDGDGYTDCGDQDCQTNPACSGSTAVQINTSAMPATVIGNHYTHNFHANGGSGVYDWSVVSTEVPSLSLNRLSGVLSGDISVCNQATPYNIQIRVEDRADSSNSDTHTFALTVNSGTLTLVPTYQTGDDAGNETFVCNSSTFDRIITATGPSVGDFNWNLSWSEPSPTGFAISQASATEGRLQKTGTVAIPRSYIASITATDDQCPANTASANFTVDVTAGGTGSPFTEGMIARWQMDECVWNGTSGEVVDTGPDGSYHGTSMGAQTIGSGKVCRSGNFNNSDYVEVPHSPSLNTPNQFTVSVWFNANSIATWDGVVSKLTNVNPGTGRGWNIQIGTAQGIASLMANSSGGYTYLRASTIPQVGQWYHVVLVHMTDNTNHLYVNGVLEGTNTFDIAFTDNPFNIGSFYTGSGGSFDGRIDEVMIWNKALTDSEVTAIYTLNRGTCSGTCYSDPVAEYSMENFPWNGTADEVKDTAGGTEENGVAAQAGTGSIPVQTSISSGRMCRSAQFTRIDSINGGYLDLGDPATLDPGSSPWSMSVWLNWDGSSGENIIYNKEYLYEAMVSGGYVRYAWMPNWAWYGGSSFPVTAGTWYHLTVVYDGRQQMMYRNGQLVYSRSQTGSMGSNASRFLIGARGSTAPRNLFGGMIDEVRIYDRALSANEIVNVYNSSASCPADYPMITTVSLADGFLGSPYSDTPTASGGTTPYGWDLLSSGVSGLSITNHNSGEIQGTIGSCAGDYNVEVRLTDDNNTTDIKLLPITVNNGALSVSSATGGFADCNPDYTQSTQCQMDVTISGGHLGNLGNWNITWQSGNPAGFEVNSTGADTARVTQTGNSTIGSGYRFRLTAQDLTCPSNTLTSGWYNVDVN